MGLPSIATLCVGVTAGSQDLCVTFPGGAKVCAQLPTVTVPDGIETARQVIAQVNAALAPVMPTIRIVEAVLAIFACLENALGIPWSTGKFVKALEELGKKVAALASLAPQLFVPLLATGILDVLISYLTALRAQLVAIAAHQAQLAAAATRATQLNNLDLQNLLTCAGLQLEAQLDAMTAGMAPLNRLIGVVNGLLALIPGDVRIPDLADLGANPEAAMATIDSTITALQNVRRLIPV